MYDKLRAGIVSVTVQIDRGFQTVMTMYTVTFYLGVGLIIVAAVGSLLLRQSLIAMIFGGLGFGDVAALLLFKPADQLQLSRGRLAQLEAAYLAWITDAEQWSGLWHQKSTNPNFKLDDFVRMSDAAVDHAGRIMQFISEFVEQSEPGSTSKQTKPLPKPAVADPGSAALSHKGSDGSPPSTS